MFNDLKAQINHIKETDPAARNSIEIVLLYPSIHAIAFYRLAHQLYKIKFIFLARMITQLGRFLTGIEIHPGAIIGKGLFIDHGMGVVIGETAVIKDHVKIFHGVTLGSIEKTHDKRHPTIGNHVTIGANANILGNIIVEDHVSIGANAVVLKDIPAYATAVGVPARIIEKKER